MIALRENAPMLAGIKKEFTSLFGGSPLIVRSPGRINLIGEHTDYNNGFVMPAAIDKGVYFALGKSTASHSVIHAGRYGESYSFDHRNPERTTSPAWANYLLGVLYQLNVHEYAIGPFNCVFDGDLPDGAGLSSSAAMECGFAFGLDKIFTLNLPRIEMIEMARWAEHNYVGVKCGIMDQFASAMGKSGHAFMLDCRSLEFQYFPLHLENCSILLCDSNVKHSLASSAYNERREQCHEGVGVIKSKFPLVDSLRDVTVAQLEMCRHSMPPLIYQRCLFVVQENQRVLDARQDLVNNDLHALGQKLHESHRGLSCLYEVSCEELDFLAAHARRCPGMYGARMMGGGFGGCTINIIANDALHEFVDVVTRSYHDAFGRDLTTCVVNTASGTSLLENRG